ncbi:hypothetical protein [Methylobacillus sp.]|uniref:hypothetical protein n=1 Tax=Methylobacillus sp. TaxID=56818 RepID=UPI002FE003A0
MGYDYKGFCHATQQQALDAFYGSHNPILFQDINGLTMYEYQLVSGQWIFQKSTIDLSGNRTITYQTQPTYPVFNTCDEDAYPHAQFMHGLELGGVVATTMVLMWCLRAIRPYRN